MKIPLFRTVKNFFSEHVFVFLFVFLSLLSLGVSTGVYLYESPLPQSNIHSYADALWWCLVTLLTVGYGDHYPITPEGRTLATILMFGGVASVGVLTAKFSSYFLDLTIQERRGTVDPSQLNDHLIICGWKSQMEEFVEHVLEKNPSCKASKIVLVNNMPEEKLEVLKENKRLNKIKFVRGNFFSEPVLKRAAPHKARKILLLADSTPHADGKIPTVSEADARTIMAAMILSQIAKGVPVVAEILDPSMKQYLKVAQVNEIIYSRDYSRLLMAAASSGTGIPNIIHQLIHPQSPYTLSTKPIPDSFLGKEFQELEAYFKEQNLHILGLLENAGNIHQVKERALREAQKTPNVSQLVENLKKVKELELNKPLLAPDKNYVVPGGALAVVLERKKEVCCDSAA